jgi:chromosome segregation ATPase
MLTGRDALFKIEQAIGGARANEGRLEAALNSAMAEAARLRQQEAEGFRALAQAKLDQMTRGETIGHLDRVEQQAFDMIEGNRREIEELGRARDGRQADLDKAEAEKHERDQELADALEALEEQQERTAQRLESDPAWQDAKKAVDAAEVVAKNADEKASLAEADLAEKRQPYEADPIFMYLWNKKHGQSGDRSGTFVKFFDRKVADLIDYHKARPNYAMLQEIPLRLREHATKKQADVAAAQQRLANIERQALVADSIEAFEASLAKMQAAAQAAGETIVKLNSALDEIEAKRQKAMDADENVAFDRAVALLSDGLSREDIRELFKDALRTAGAADDQAVSSISAAREALQKTDAEVSQIRAEIREQARRRTELEDARDRARSQGYDNPRGSFGNAGGQILGEVLGQILRGAATGAVLDGVFRDNYRAPRRRRTSGPIFGGFPSGGKKLDPWGGGGSGTWGRSGPSKGGRSGGWRTGGRF